MKTILSEFFSTKKQMGLMTLLFLSSMTGFSQDDYRPAVESFESPNTIGVYDATNSKLSLSEAHRRFGKSSLKWDWTGDGSSFGTSAFKILSKDESPLEYPDDFPISPTLQMSIYNETPQDGVVTIAFEKGGQPGVHFDLPINFKGLRRIWVPFFEMQGNPPAKGASVDYDYFKISTAIPQGTLFFDDITFSQFQDDRHQYPDELVPFIKEGQNLAKDHWMPLIVNYDRIKSLKSEPISSTVKADLKKLEELIDQNFAVSENYKVNMNSLRADFQKLGIKDNGQTILGPPLTFKEIHDFHDEKQQGPIVYNDIKDLGIVLKSLASAYHRGTPEEQAEIKTMFLTGTKYYLDQGWVAGSNGGTRHHVGYNVRELTEAFFMMRQVLNDNGMLSEVGGSLHWLSNLGSLLEDPENFYINIDYLNTQAYNHLVLMFLLEKPEDQAQLVQAYSNYLSITLAQQKEEWGFKVDGTAWHHNGHYPAYGLGAFQSVPKIIKTLSGTQFRIRPEGHANFKNAFLASRIYSQLYNWGFGNAGRHPLEDNGIQSLPQQFLDMAYSGNPDNTSKIDQEVAGAYLRLWGAKDQKATTDFKDNYGIKEETLSGYYTFPYGATAIHRRNDWAAIIKGYSKYVWASEIYMDTNRYGRYPANGTIQLLNPEGETGSGMRMEGWDWNRYPGATVIYLPFKELETKLNLIMFRSMETFAGTTELDGNGIFGMILDESEGTNADGNEAELGFPGKLKAKKSVFSFGEKLIAIGTNISSVDQKNPTQTNIFQTTLVDTKTPIHTSSETITQFPSETTLKGQGKSGSWLIDPYGNGYHILSDTSVEIKTAHQHSYNSKYSVNNGNSGNTRFPNETEGDYATAWINHGLAPKNVSYQYVIYPFLDAKDQKNFGEIAKKDKSFAIERADAVAHIVYDQPSKTTGYVIFEAHKPLNTGILNTVSEPALIMLKENSKSHITISAVQPDLNFPEYQKDKFRNYSQPVELEMTLNGKWKPSAEDFVESTSYSDGKTKLKLKLVNGLPGEFTLNKL